MKVVVVVVDNRKALERALWRKSGRLQVVLFGGARVSSLPRARDLWASRVPAQACSLISVFRRFNIFLLSDFGTGTDSQLQPHFHSTYHGRLLQREHCLQAGCHYRPSSSSYHHSHSFPFVHLIQFFFSFLLSFGVPVCLEIFGSTGKDGVGILRVLPRVLVCPPHLHMLTGVSNE